MWSCNLRSKYNVNLSYLLRLIFDCGGALYGLNLSAAGPYRRVFCRVESN